MNKILAVLMLALCGALAAAPQAVAVEPDEVLENPALEARARDIGRQLRCVVCQSQSIDDSDAPLAKDMRLLVRERLVAGDSDEEIYAYLVDRYGDYVLLNPPVQGNTILLWAAPVIIFLGAAASAFIYLVNMRREAKKAAGPDTHVAAGGDNSAAAIDETTA